MSYLSTAARLIAARYNEAGRAVYGGIEPEGEALACSYKYWRQLGRAPRAALQRAALDYFRRDRRYPRRHRFDAMGVPFSREGLRWADDPGAVGLRFVGFADDIAGRAIEHRGWYTDSDGFGEVLRGAVYQLPGRNGRTRYLAAYREGSEGKRGWTDMGYDGAAAIACREVFEAERGDSDAYYLYRGGDAPEAAREAARRADSITETIAEDQREYNEAWQAARQWSDLADDIAELRAQARQLVADMRAAIKSGVTAAPSICAALRKSLRGLIEDAAELKAERESLADDFYYWRDRRQYSIAEFAADHI